MLETIRQINININIQKKIQTNKVKFKERKNDTKNVTQ